jgi:hypothetical protein
MLRRLIVVTVLATGMSIAAAVALATPALAKGPSQARITGPRAGSRDRRLRRRRTRRAGQARQPC